tara:strand:- start:570 stop:1286 length:717 start_codon:yes stop_codon:yes gene_type:complete
MNILSIIPARGGSKGIPRKNIRRLNSKPLIYYSIKASLNSKKINRTIVSTDDDEISKIARDYQAEVPFIRPEELAQDDVTDYPVFNHCLQWLEDNESYFPDIIVNLRPTSPLRSSIDIDICIEKLQKEENADSLRSISYAGQHPLKMWKIIKGELQPFTNIEAKKFYEPFNMPRQKLPSAYIQNGCIDVIKYDTLKRKKSMSGSNIIPYLMENGSTVNIDTEVDWLLAEILMKKGNKK